MTRSVTIISRGFDAELIVNLLDGRSTLNESGQKEFMVTSSFTLSH
jgi:hypothetical protein